MRLKGSIEDLFYETPGSAAVDLRSRVDVLIPPHPGFVEIAGLLGTLVKADSLQAWQPFAAKVMEMEFEPNWSLIPTGVYLGEAMGLEHIDIRPRSGLANKHGIVVLNTPGLIDSDYPGEIGVILINNSLAPFEIKNGDRIAQMVLMNHTKFDNIPTKEAKRSGGFGSTGM